MRFLVYTAVIQRHLLRKSYPLSTPGFTTTAGESNNHFIQCGLAERDWPLAADSARYKMRLHGTTTFQPCNISKLKLTESLSHLLTTAIPIPFKIITLEVMRVKCLEQHQVGADVNIIIINIVSFINTMQQWSESTKTEWTSITSQGGSKCWKPEKTGYRHYSERRKKENRGQMI